MNDNKLKEEMNGLVLISANEYKRLILIEQHDKNIIKKDFVEEDEESNE